LASPARRQASGTTSLTIECVRRAPVSSQKTYGPPRCRCSFSVAAASAESGTGRCRPLFGVSSSPRQRVRRTTSCPPRPPRPHGSGSAWQGGGRPRLEARSLRRASVRSQARGDVGEPRTVDTASRRVLSSAPLAIGKITDPLRLTTHRRGFSGDNFARLCEQGGRSHGATQSTRTSKLARKSPPG
jgi:hypothetical protein